MFTTLNCDLLETKYYYISQHSGQGEKECSDTLSWLKYVPNLEENHSTRDESLETLNPNTTGATQDPPPNLTSEVSNSHSSQSSDSPKQTSKQNEPVEDTGASNHETTTEQDESLQEQAVQEETPERYVLPPRANRGVPPKRYSPEKEPQRSRYPMANIAIGNLSREAKAFVSSIYSEEVPTNIEQALTSKNWKNTMKTEMEALMKNDTWEKCVLPLDVVGYLR